MHFFFKYLLASATVGCVLAAMLWFIPGFHAWNPIYAMTTVSCQRLWKPVVLVASPRPCCLVLMTLLMCVTKETLCIGNAEVGACCSRRRASCAWTRH